MCDRWRGSQLVEAFKKGKCDDLLLTDTTVFPPYSVLSFFCQWSVAVCETL